MNLIKKVLLCIIIFTEATLLYGEESTEKQIPQNPVFKLNLDYIYIPDVMSDRTEEIESKKDREWESKEYNASAAANFTFFDSLKITNKAQYGRAEYSAEGFPKELIVMGNEITLSYGDLLIMGGAKYAADSYSKTIDAIDFSFMGGGTVYTSGHHSINAGVFYSSDQLMFDWGTFFPYVSYKYKSGTFFFESPMPLIIMWFPTSKLSFKILSVFFLWNNASIEYKAASFLTISAEYSRNAESYYIEDHNVEDEKLIIEKQSAGLRIKSDIGKYVGLYIFGGYQFGSRSFYSDSALDFKADKEHINNSIVVKAGAEMRVF